MKSYEKALEALKAKYEAQAHAVGDLRAFSEERPIKNIWRA